MTKLNARRVLASLVALTAVMSFAAGCSDDDDDGDDGGDDTTQVTEAPVDTEAPATTGS